MAVPDRSVAHDQRPGRGARQHLAVAIAGPHAGKAVRFAEVRTGYEPSGSVAGVKRVHHQDEPDHAPTESVGRGIDVE